MTLVKVVKQQEEAAAEEEGLKVSLQNQELKSRLSAWRSRLDLHLSDQRRHVELTGLTGDPD